MKVYGGYVMRKTKHMLHIALFVIAVLTVFNVSACTKSTSQEHVVLKTKEDYEQRLLTLQNDKVNHEKRCSDLQKKWEQSKQQKASLSSLSQAIDRAKDDIMKIQKEAIYIGKFICKVNTCQGNPDDKNYHIYVDKTRELENAKQKLFRANDAYDKAKQAVDKMDDYEEKIKESTKQLQQVEQEIGNIEKKLINWN